VEEVPDEFSRELSVAAECCRAGDSRHVLGRYPQAGRWPASGSWRPARRTLRLLEESLRWLGSWHGIRAPCLLRASSLTLAGALASSWVRLRSRGSLNAVAWCQTDLELDDLVPDGICALVVGDRQEFPQAAARIRKLRLVAHGLGSLLLVGCGLERWLSNGFFFVHGHIIARIERSNPVLPVTSNALLVFFLNITSNVAARRLPRPPSRGQRRSPVAVPSHEHRATGGRQ